MKLRTLDWLRAHCKTAYREGRVVAMASGCFDVLHPGHIMYLQAAREMGDELIVALNSDASVQALKGPTRPLSTERNRALVLSALECVNHVLIFGEERVTQTLEELRPCVWVKGGDYTLESLHAGERARAESLGISIRFVPTVEGFSTSGIIKRLQEA